MVNRIFKNSLANLLGLSISLAITFFITPFIIHKLGDLSYGLWALIISVIAYASILDIGIGFPLVHYVARYKSKRDKGAINRFCSTSFVLFLAFGVIGFVIMAIFASFLIQRFNVPAELLGVARKAVLIGAMGVFISFPFGVYSSILRGYQKYTVLNIILGLTAIIKAILIIIVLSTGRISILHLALIEAGTVFLSSLLKFSAARKVDPDIKVSFKLFDKNIVSNILVYGLSLFIMSLAVQLVWYTDSFVIGYFLPISLITIYAVGHKLNEIYKNMIARMIYVIFPLFAELEANKDFNSMRNLLLYVTKYITAISTPIAIFLIIMSRSIVQVWIGENYILSSSILSILAVASLVSLTSTPTGTFIQATDRQKKFLWISAVHSLGNLLLSLILVRRFGIIGVAWGTAIPFFLCTYFLTIPLACRYLSLPYKKFLVTSILPSFMPAFICTASIFAISSLVIADNYPKLMLFALVSFSIFQIMFICFSTNVKERRIFINQVISPAFKAIKI